MRLEVHATSDAGLVRSHNEDMALVAKRLVRDSRYDSTHEIPDRSRPYAIAVSDGLGGQSAGEVASELVLDCLRTDISTLKRNAGPAVIMQELAHIADGIQEHLISRASAIHRYRGMATTLTALIYYEREFFLFHVGDTRCYVYKNGVLNQITRDHTLRELEGDPRIPGNILSNCFGSQESFFADVRQLTNGGDEGDVFLLCSDGLSDMVEDETTEAILRESATMRAAGERLLREAREMGGRDNITFVLARVL